MKQPYLLENPENDEFEARIVNKLQEYFQWINQSNCKTER